MRSRPAFTAIELIVVLAIFVVAIAITLPFLGKFQQEETLTTVTQDIVQTLRRAQNKSMNGERGVAWGVALQEGAYIQFAGPSYSSGRIVRLDEKHTLQKTFTLYGPPEILFAKRTGYVGTEAVITLQGPERGLSNITVNAEGGISYESL